MVLSAFVLALISALLPALCFAQGSDVQARAEDLPWYLRDRGTGIPTSMFGTYIEPGEFLFYPFFEHYRDDDAEYRPTELGYEGDEDFRGRYRASEGLIFLGYGVSDRLAVELEAAVIEAELEKSPGDHSGVPAEIEESGLGDVEGQFRFRWSAENERRPEIFNYFEYVLPLQKDKVLIGTQGWEFKLGTGVVKGFRWGTMTWRVAGEYSVEESKFDLGEYAVEYLRRLSPTWRVYGGVEGTQDEVALIAEAQVHLTSGMFLKLNNSFGLTSKAGRLGARGGARVQALGADHEAPRGDAARGGAPPTPPA